MRKFVIFMPNFRYFIVTADFWDVILHFLQLEIPKKIFWQNSQTLIGCNIICSIIYSNLFTKKFFINLFYRYFFFKISSNNMNCYANNLQINIAEKNCAHCYRIFSKECGYFLITENAKHCYRILRKKCGYFLITENTKYCSPK